MSDKEKENTTRPWYEEPWTWGLMAGPAIVVVAGFITLAYALSMKDTLVTDDYYKEGKNIVLEVERDQSAAKHNLSAQIYIQPNLDGVMVIIDGEYDKSQELTLTFFHNIKENDLSINLKPSENQTKQYVAQFPKALANAKNWIVRLEDNAKQWRLEKRWDMEQDGNSFVLTPKYKN